MSWFPDNHPEEYLEKILEGLKTKKDSESFDDLDKDEVRDNPTWPYAIIMDNLIKDLSLTPSTYSKVNPQELLKNLSSNGKKYLDYYSISSNDLKLDIKKYVLKSKLRENKERNNICSYIDKNSCSIEKNKGPKTAEELISEFDRLIG
jgi:hypothetical protein